VLRVGYDTVPLALNRAGEARYTKALLGALREHDDIELEVLSPTDRLPRDGLHRVAVQLAVQAVWYPLSVPRAARRRRLDVVHHTRHLVPPEPGLRTPTVVSVHDVLPLSHPELFSRAILANFRLLVPGAVRRARRIVTGSQHTARELTRLLDVDPAKIDVTPYGVDPRFRPTPPDPAWLAESYGITGPYVACVGTLEPRKNLAGAVRAFTRIEDPEVRLVVIGGAGWGNDDFERARGDLGDRLVLTGYVPDEDLVPLLSGARCFLYPSLLEGFGFPPLEAMACGTPVVASDRASLPEVIGDAGLLVDPDDEAAIAAAVASVLEDDALAERLRTAALARAKLYTWERCAASTIEVYQRAMD
jgi:alpha-1,3-rhamnosyl/mannosyltransferase